MRSIFVSVSLLLVFAFNSACAQTIHLKDLDRFLCKFRLRDTMPQDASHPNGLPRCDLSTIIEWKLDSTDSDGQRWSASHPPREHNCEWLCLDVAKQQNADIWIAANRPDSKSGEFQYYVLWDVEGYGGLNDVLTLWQRVGRDSLRFVCAQDQYYGGNLSRAWVEKGAQFPDGSVMLCVHEAFGDADAYFEKFSFLRGESPCELRPFYVRQYDQDSKAELRYDFSHMSSSPFRVTETSLYVSLDSSGENRIDPRTILDSASSRVIDLWEIARDSLGIHSTKSDFSLKKRQPPVAPEKR